jgi:hypothetical protein
MVPLAGFTVALNTVEALWAMLAGLAAIDAVVAISAAAAVSVTGVDTDVTKLPLPA